MRKLFFILILVVSSELFAQDAVFNSKRDTLYAKSKLIEIGAGGFYSSLNYFKNAGQSTFFPGYSARVLFQPNNYIRFCADLSQVTNVNIEPTWLNVSNRFIDVDMHFLMRFFDRISSAYFILGFSTQQWKGFYTGIDDYNAPVLKIQKNTEYSKTYYGGNIGMGVEFKILPRLDIYSELRWRLTQTDVGFGLSDVCWGAGIKFTVLKLNPFYRKLGDRYHWF